MGTGSQAVVEYLSTAVNFGALGIIFWLFVGGRLHSEDEIEYVRRDLDAERKAHDMTRQALTVANERANTSVLTSELVLKALGGGGK